jgi:hypothetical protein
MDIPESDEVKEQRIHEFAKTKDFPDFVEGTILAVVLSVFKLIGDSKDEETTSKYLAEVVETATKQIVYAKEQG